MLLVNQLLHYNVEVEHITGVHNNDQLASGSVTARSSVAIAEISSKNSKVLKNASITSKLFTFFTPQNFAAYVSAITYILFITMFYG